MATNKAKQKTYNEQLEEEYQQQFGDIPLDYNARLNYMIDKYRVTPKQMDDIIERKRNMMFNMQFYDYFILDLSKPRIKPRPRSRIIHRKNYMDVAAANPMMVHVYTPHARDEINSMHRLIGDELEALHVFIQTPCTIVLNCYEKTPEAFSVADKFLAEQGLIPSISHNDADNFLKLASDRLNTNLWLDDSLVISCTVNKFYSILPREEIFIKYLNVVPTKNQYKAITGRKGFNPEYPIDYLDKFGNVQMGDIL